ncbi:Pro-Pol polyprotein [Cyphomyrmex costatus]|uniref:Pro-Pol polyprotein n=1 Tax=Cyphomyrmex costatus TaxID=456900 RepID=A0A151I7B5_9HYME|nr:Pro-Pol polyprotein [Cyphomyrmex costatus]
MLHIQNCIKCISFSRPSGKIEGFLHNIPKGNEPFAVVHADHFGPVDRANTVKKYILVIVDGFTKYVKLYAVKTTTTRDTIRCLRDYFQVYSRPKILVSDRGTSFTSKEFEEFALEMNIKHVKVATASPQANGQVERYNRMLAPALGKLYTGKD